MTTHNLKILSIYFYPVRAGRKTFEVRVDDRGYKAGDILQLREWKGDGYTGRELSVRVTYIFPLPSGSFDSFPSVVMAIKLLDVLP